jgi:hypothetical protein
VWSGSHPFFTGKMTYVDSAGRIEKFNRKFGGNYFGKKDAKKATPAAAAPAIPAAPAPAAAAPAPTPTAAPEAKPA